MMEAPSTESLDAKVQPSIRVDAKVFVSDQESEAVIRQVLADLGIEDFTVVTGDVLTATKLLAKQSSPQLLIVDITGIEEPLSSILDLADVCEPGVGVIVIGQSNDIALYRQLKGAGVVEYIFKPLVREQLIRACNAALTDGSDQPNLFPGKLVFVLGVRGGVGATTLATNAAWHIAEIRQRWAALVDLDLQWGDAALLFDVAPGPALREAFERPERVDKLFLERGAIHVNKRLNMYASLEPLGTTTEGSDEGARQVLEILLRRYRVVFVDLPGKVAEHLPQMLQLPSTCILVANPSLTAARDIIRWRDFLGANTRERRTLQVLNYTRPYGGLTEAEFARASGQAPDMVIGYDRELAMAANLGVPAMQKCTVFKYGIMPILHEVTGERVEKPSSIFARLFGT
jgi:pilus assembly protein CpaE